MSSLGYQLYFETPGFVQFEPNKVREGLRESDDCYQWAIDLVVVESQTFTKLFATAEFFTYGSQEALATVSPLHLIAMKLHALKQSGRNEKLKDLRDIVELVRYLKLDIEALEFRALCDKYVGSDLSGEVYEQIKKFAG